MYAVRTAACPARCRSGAIRATGTREPPRTSACRGKRARCLANPQRLGRLAIGWAPCLLGLAVLAVVGRRHVRAWRWPLFVLALAGVPLAMYVAIHIEYRYIGALVVLLLMAAFAAMRGPDTQQARRLTAAVVTVVFVAQVTPRGGDDRVTRPTR